MQGSIHPYVFMVYFPLFRDFPHSHSNFYFHSTLKIAQVARVFLYRNLPYKYILMHETKLKQAYLKHGVRKMIEPNITFALDECRTLVSLFQLLAVDEHIFLALISSIIHRILY